MAWGMGGSKDPNKRNENSHFDENYKKTADCIGEGPKTAMKMTETTNAMTLAKIAKTRRMQWHSA